MAQTDGGAAFPAEYAGFSAQGAEITIMHPGMSLRDYFAAAALTGIVSSPEAMVGMREVGVGYGMGVEEYASRMAYEMADAMLVERERFRS